MANISCSYFGSQISQTNSKEIKEKISLPGNCPLFVPFINSELWTKMLPNQRKGDAKLATLQKSLVKVVAGVLHIFTDV